MRELPSSQNTRRARRLKLFEPVDVKMGVETRRGHLLDVSTSGALLHIGEPPPPGILLTLVIAGRPRTGKVAWADGSRCGISFTVPLPAPDLDALVDAAIAVQR